MKYFVAPLLLITMGCVPNNIKQSTDAKTLEMENNSLNIISKEFDAGNITSLEAMEKLETLLIDNGKIDKSAASGFNLNSDTNKQTSFLRFDTAAKKADLCSAVSSAASNIINSNLYAYTSVAAYYKYCPTSLCSIDLANAGLGVVPNVSSFGQAAIYDFKNQTFSMNNVANTSLHKPYIGSSAYGYSGFFWRSLKTNPNILQVFNNKVGFNFEYNVSTKEVASFLDPSSAALIKFLLNMLGINASFGFATSVVAKQGKFYNASGTSVGGDGKHYKDGVEYYFDKVLTPVVKTMKKENTTSFAKTQPLLNAYRDKVDAVVPSYISLGTGLLADLFDATLTHRQFMEEPSNIGFFIEGSASLKLSGWMRKFKDAFNDLLSLPLGEFSLGQLNWYPLAPDTYWLKPRNFFGMGNETLVLPSDALGAGYLQFPTPWHMAAHMLQTGNTPALLLFMLYQQAQIAAKTIKHSSKKICQ